MQRALATPLAFSRNLINSGTKRAGAWVAKFNSRDLILINAAGSDIRMTFSGGNKLGAMKPVRDLLEFQTARSEFETGHELVASLTFARSWSKEQDI